MDFVLALALSLSTSLAPLQTREGARVDTPTTVTCPTVLVGRAVTARGLPVGDAVITTSAGGRSVTAADGTFALALDVALEAEQVEVTAVAERADGASLFARARVQPASLSPTTSVGRLVLLPTVTCRTSWRPEFGEKPGTSGRVFALTVFDDGSGPALYAGGDFTTAGGADARYVAKRVGSRWEPVGSVTNNNHSVHALAVFDDGSGPALFAGGTFTAIGGVLANAIAKWDGTSWSALGSGISGTGGSLPLPDVRALAVYDDGAGAALYAAGYFLSAGGTPAFRIAKWDGASWSALDTGIGGVGDIAANAMSVFDDGGGPALYVGGNFTSAGGIEANRIARWDGSSWTALGSGIAGATNAQSVFAATVFDGGDGPALYVGGNFTSAGGVTARGSAKWDGASWSALGSVNPPRVRALTVFDDGSGPALYAGGQFATSGTTTNGIARWDGASWSALAGGMSGATPGTANATSVDALAGFDDGTGPVLYAGGDFLEADGSAVNFVAAWDGASWAPLGRGLDDSVRALAVFDDGGGAALYAGGAFSHVGGAPASAIAEWDGSHWAPLGTGVEGSVPSVDALAVFEGGGGPALYAGGSFSSAGRSAADNIARWNGSGWSALGSGVDSLVRALAVFDGGTGAALCVGGSFTHAGGQVANRIAKWNGSSWSTLGSGVDGAVMALAVFDDGDGPALFAGGVFVHAGGAPANFIARWDGASWTPLVSGVDGSVMALTVFDDGTGPALYAGGEFTTAGDEPAYGIARWDGSSWNPLGSGLSGGIFNGVFALAVFDDGAGPALYAGGGFTTAGGVAATGIARWDGTGWSPLGSGLGFVDALAVFDDGSGAELQVGGAFVVSPSADSFLAKWACAGRARREH